MLGFQTVAGGRHVVLLILELPEVVCQQGFGVALNSLCISHK